ncbi:TIGR03750 family conjugal transfer protein [Pseudomonas sp. MAFF 311095]|uniref:TIGR03750 family conjugal transfer protein n=1 Tax=Pseudomonas petroselini TaxID=2899822 RepID=A0ABS8QWS6_9PSED|nr:TIGR03750 family conjugal transfer protein [Pseudomonas petroselini]MCD7038852.1 TIGR03750 family conjugal transfer protein [Pseudomonas petroselini]MCD7043997.1 TIGR03750 family conjugal transfer protein [Pseudomonas petroselini]MCD7067275.1 TIGR03750 family conjugal transfer protein [Pseudomonas petroselini]MCD7080281.1 TIGR03750 family conjugal transfer protein [Pseudomonas petroselini]
MNDTIERLADGTLVFLPERLNRNPAVLRGLTNNEMWVALGAGAFIGLVLGAPLAIATSSIAVAPTSMIASMAVVLFAGGTLLRRAKRARPETWLYRKLEWTLTSRWRLGRSSLILHSGAWTVRRSRRLRPALSRWQP